MRRWALGLLVGAMALWTAFTGLAGWYAWRGDASTPAEAQEVVAVQDVASPDGGRHVRALSEADVLALRLPATEAEAVAAPTPREGISRPVPREADSGGFDGRVKPANGEITRNKPVATRSAKGVVVLDPGHGRGDPGATHYLNDGSGRWDVTEAESNQLNAELIRDALIAKGYDVYLTREGAGRGPGGPLPLQFITSDLYARVQLARAVDADVYLAIHGNGAVVKSISGPETWYCGKHEEGAANERLATLVQQAMMDALHEYGYSPPDRGIKEDAESHHSGDFCQFVVTRETAVPAALLEFLFLSNDADAAVLVDRRSHELMAQHVADAIDTFMTERRGEAQR
jgi:N-acetylmuramoyl-L-alanine amidase